MNKLNDSFWSDCLVMLEQKVDEKDFYTWLKPLECVGSWQEVQQGSAIYIYAHNHFVYDHVKSVFWDKIYQVMLDVVAKTYGKTADKLTVKFAIGSPQPADGAGDTESASPSQTRAVADSSLHYGDQLHKDYIFSSFVEGNSNQMAKTAALAAASASPTAGNPLLLYGPSGLGKTHLMQAIGNYVLKANSDTRVIYVRFESFFRQMVRAIRQNNSDAFKNFYRSADMLLVDDVHLLAGKDHTQEEFFHTFNALLENDKQMVFTSDRYPKEIKGLEDRIKSRIGWGLPVSIDPPELETRMAILQKKAKVYGYQLSEDSALLIAEKIKSNVRELEGALRLVVSTASFKGVSISSSLISEALNDLFAQQEKSFTIDNIQRLVCDYFKLSVSELLSKRRSRSLARPRQIAMALAKEFTAKSLPEIGQQFGGRNHTTVMHACKTIAQLCVKEQSFKQDYERLTKLLLS